jgi:hypothetical protein
VVSQSDAVTLQNFCRAFPAAATQFDIAIFSASSFVAPTAQPAPWRAGLGIFGFGRALMLKG